MKKHIKLANDIIHAMAKTDLGITDSARQWKRAMKAIIDTHVPIEKPFPKVMNQVNTLELVFFKSKKIGVWISGKHAGYESSKLDIRAFKDCNIGVIS